MTLTSGTQTFQATHNVTANLGFTISGSASITFAAGNQIVLGPGFQATAGTQVDVNAASKGKDDTTTWPHAGTRNTMALMERLCNAIGNSRPSPFLVPLWLSGRANWALELVADRPEWARAPWQS